MADDFNEFSEYDELHSLMERHNLLSLFKKLPFKERIRRIVQGMKADKQSGEYKWARLQVTRMTAPASAFLVPIVGLLILSLLASMAPKRERVVEVTVQEKQEVEELDEKIELDKDPIQPPDPIDAEFTPDIAVQSDYENIVNAPTTELSPKPAEMDAVSMVKSPVMMKGILGNRNPGMRGRAMKAFGGSGKTEAAVMRALRWLKKNQNSDGSWGPTKPAMTSLALLAFLAHNETPASEEFGQTVLTAMQWLIDNQNADGHFRGRDNHDYSHPIAAYALCEAFALTKVPAVGEAAEKAIARVISGQNPSGGFNYNLNPSERNDTSYMSWCAQSLKAASMAGIGDTGAVEAAMKKAIDGFNLNHRSNPGYFGYTGRTPGASKIGNGLTGLTGASVLALQLLGEPNAGEAKRGLTFMTEQGKCDWSLASWRSIYYWYYDTQARFHSGGSTWDSWNAQMAPTLVNNQSIEKEAIMGPDGKMKDIGWWTTQGAGGEGDRKDGGLTMNTTLSALSLMVYYRYLPTFQTPTSLDQAVEEFDEQDDEIEIQIAI